jgi:uncharacterized repeat protein (TIGR03803 family)
MKAYPQHGASVRLLALVLLAVFPPPIAQAQTFKVLYSFTGGPDGGQPEAGPLLDASGNLYGTTSAGGDSGCFYGTCGVVFELTPGSAGWPESVLHTFTGGSDGGNPEDSLTFDAAGNLYGTADVGGVSCGQAYGCGVAFELSPGSNGWTETVLHSFQGGVDGYYPIAALVLDKHGHLYSTTVNGGGDDQGSVYELSEGVGGWSEKALYNFTWSAEPASALVLDEAGNLYGTTTSSNSGGGTVFELRHGSRQVSILHIFDGSDGSTPEAAVVFDRSGNLYGTTEGGGKYGKGVVFKLAPGAKGKWKETVLHNFKGESDGAFPFGTPVFDKAGNLYGTTYNGGDATCICGTVFKLSPTKEGPWKEKILHRFTGGSDGAHPYFVQLAIDPSGNLYGTTVAGGNTGCGDYGCGVVFEITP